MKELGNNSFFPDIDEPQTTSLGFTFAVELSKVCLEKSNDHILSNINLQVKPGEKLAILGPNGSGKSHLLFLIAGLIKPTSGIIQVLGTAPIPGKTSLSMVMQDPAVAAVETTVERELAFDLENRAFPTDVIIRKVHNLLQKFNLEYCRFNNIEELAGGERQKTFIAAALSSQPAILLLDEPFAHLDPHSKFEIRDSITNLKNLTIILTSQNAEDCIRFDRIITLQNTTLASEFSSSELLSNLPTLDKCNIRYPSFWKKLGKHEASLQYLQDYRTIINGS